MKKLGSVIGGLGLGAAAMYLFDPKKGPGRRAMIRDKASSAVNAQRRAATTLARHTGNKVQGLIHEAKNKVMPMSVSDHKLVERIRSELGHAVSNVSDIQVSARDGMVSLGGDVAESEKEAMMAAVWGIPGVKAVSHGSETEMKPSMMEKLEEKTGLTGKALALGVAGGLLAMYGATRRDRVGKLVGAVGVGMLRKGIAHRHSQQMQTANADSGWR